MNMIWLLRLRRLAQNPPSPKQLKLIAAVVLIAFLIFGFERLFGWPDWLTIDKGIRR